MLRNLALLLLLAVLPLAAHAEDKSSQFIAFYRFNTQAMGPYVQNDYIKSCTGKYKRAESECTTEAITYVKACNAYASYRMTTEKNMDDLKIMDGCGKNKAFSPQCPQAYAYIFKTYEDCDKAIRTLGKESQK